MFSNTPAVEVILFFNLISIRKRNKLSFTLGPLFICFRFEKKKLQFLVLFESKYILGEQKKLKLYQNQARLFFIETKF